MRKKRKERGAKKRVEREGIIEEKRKERERERELKEKE